MARAPKQPPELSGQRPVPISGHPKVQAERKEALSVTPGQLQGPLELNQSRVVFLCLSSNSFQGFISYIYLGSCARKIFQPSLHFPFPSGSSRPNLPPNKAWFSLLPGPDSESETGAGPSRILPDSEEPPGPSLSLLLHSCDLGQPAS